MLQISHVKQTIEKEDIDAIVSVLLENNNLKTNKSVCEFEKKISAFTNSKYAIAVNNETSALRCALNALDIQPENEVIVTSIGSINISNCVLYEKGIPIFADIDPRTINIDANKIENLITSNTKAIIVTHFAGQLCDMIKIKYIASQHNLKIIEYAPNALGTVDVGKYGDIATFGFNSFNLTTCDGGMIITNNIDMYKKMLIFRNNGILQGDMISLGYNLHMTEMQGALGISQITRLPIWIKIRKALANIYNNSFKPYSNLFEPLKQLKDNSYNFYVIKLNTIAVNRDTLLKKLSENKIEVDINYKPSYLHAYYKLKGLIGKCPNAENVYTQLIALPLYPTLKDNELQYIIDTFIKIILDK